MVTLDASNSHFEYMDVVRHWSPTSQKYAGGDAIITLINEGWKIGETVFYEEYWYAGARLVGVYHLQLERNGERLHVPVLSNPYVRRMLKRLPVQIRPMASRHSYQPR
jgi:hypothetical protein